MDRRAFLGALGLLASPLTAGAQQPGRIPVVGVLNTSMGSRSRTSDIIREGLRDLGYVEGRTIALDVRFAAMKQEAFPRLAADLVRRTVVVLVAIGPAATRAAKDSTSTIPIVALDLESDPIQAGFASSFAQPGGNITGCFLDQPAITGKWLELIGDAVPGIRRIAVLVDATTGEWQQTAITAAAEKRRVDLQAVKIRRSEELDPALHAAVRRGAGALVQLSSPLFDLPLVHKRLVAFTVQHRLPTISMFRRFAEAGGLMSYGPNVEYYKRLPVYIDKILKGAKPGDLPIEQPTKFELVINLKTAKALGLTIPPLLLQRADQVIE
jgi:putative ABC transport system substrate-binding protein